ncbi:glycoside hydrolase family 31 protein [Limosilactobacillus kribbianus]|uniref:glycoside hydrolase family 31 protein n=1 Tax=Limosilactobacillus kribbianus TaxID=2982695 RepID=UPI00226419D8|nr:glycoside hydrolase family 31 protein [Limosilactobacillus kribbianus]
MTEELTDYQQDGSQIKLHYRDGQDLLLDVYTSEIIRVFVDRGRTTNSYAISGDKHHQTSFTVENKGDHVEVRTAALIVRAYDGHHVDFYDGEGNPLVIDFRGERTPLPNDLDDEHKQTVLAEGHDISLLGKTNQHYYEVIKSLAPDEVFYGLGDKPGFLNKRGYDYDNWNVDFGQVHDESVKCIYKSIPVMYGIKDNHPYGLFFDNTYKSHFDLGKESENYYYYSAVDGNVDYYVLGGHTLKDVVANYTYLTGTTPLPQKWTLGYQQSRWGYSTSEQRVEEIADGFAKYHLPLDVIHLDIDYMRGYRDFTWDTTKYSDPKKFVAEMRKCGIRLIPILDAGVKKDEDGYDIYEEGVKNGYFVQNPDGTTYFGRVWPGKAAFPDFGQPRVRQWWAKHIKFFADLGAAGIWNDMNEPASFDGELPNDLIFSDGEHKSTHAKMHNVFGQLQAQAAYEGMREATEKRPFVITRAAYAGIQKYSTVWTGDNQSIWSNLQLSIPQLTSLGLSGIAIAGTDIGGFQKDTTPELLTRWIEAALFAPLFRNHAEMGTRYQEPWQFDARTLDIYRDYLNLRYRFVPFLYDQFHHETESGLPVMRPLVLNYDQDPQVRQINDEYMVGTSILVAPIVNQGATQRLVYLPAGKWLDFWNNAEYSGQQSIVVNAPLDKLPMFIKADTILPWGNKVKHISDQPEKVMTFRLFGECGSYRHYQDNGQDFKYQDGEYNEYYVAVSLDGQVTVKLNKHGYQPTYDYIYVETSTGRWTFKYNAASENYLPVK